MSAPADGWRVHLDHGIATQRQPVPGGAQYRVYRPDPAAPVTAPSWQETGLFIAQDARARRARQYGLYRARPGGAQRLAIGRYLRDAVAAAARLTAPKEAP